MNQVSETAGRKSRAEWAELMAKYEAGDLPQREFCERSGVAYSTFGYWRKQLRSPALPMMPAAAEPLLELSPFGVDDTMNWRVELDLGCGVKWRVR
jgi:hypothetical protein